MGLSIFFSFRDEDDESTEKSSCVFFNVLLLFVLLVPLTVGSDFAARHSRPPRTALAGPAAASTADSTETEMENSS